LKRIGLYFAGLCLAAGSLAAAESTLMHCFAFTPIKEATQADWDAFYKATDELPKKIKGLRRVWYGKLLRPLKQGENVREHGVCMEFQDEAAFKAYDPDPAHKAWVDVYSKVRVPGTTTYQILPMKK
jgi:Stress responsive A/B Barrel Domain